MLAWRAGTEALIRPAELVPQLWPVSWAVNSVRNRATPPGRIDDPHAPPPRDRPLRQHLV